MTYKTQAICLNSTKYGESSLITTLYTRELGRQSVMIKGARKPKAKIRSNMLQPLSIVNIEIDIKPQRELQYLQDLNIDYPYSSIPFDVVKSTQALFIAEFLQKMLKDADEDHQLFDFLISSFKAFDCENEGMANFTLFFLVRITSYLGIELGCNNNSSEKYFDMLECDFCTTAPNHPCHFTEELTASLKQLCQQEIATLYQLKLNNASRRELLNKLIQYIGIQLDYLPKLSSLDVLKEIFS